MHPNNPARAEFFLGRVLRPGWRFASLLIAAASVVLFSAILVANVQAPQLALAVPIALAAAILSFVVLLGVSLRQLRRKENRVTSALEISEQQLQQMANNIQEIFWVVDLDGQPALRVNQAYEAITGRTGRSLGMDPRSFRDVIHPEDRSRVLARLADGAPRNPFEEQFRIVRPEGEVRWVWVRGFPVEDAYGKASRLVGTALDITSQKEAEAQVASNLALANSACAEADALRKATLGLTEDLHMNYVLDTLLQSVTTLIACDEAQILLLEGDSRLLVAREKPLHPPGGRALGHRIVEASEFPFFQQLVVDQKSVLLPDTGREAVWRTSTGEGTIRSWLAVPLIASRATLGVLALGNSQVMTLTEEHLRLGNSLAISAAAAIQNARLYERAAIYGAELEKRMVAMAAAEKALKLCEEDRELSEKKFQKIFRSSPLPFCITTAEEGRFMDVNPAFEVRYGYSRAELIGHTVEELRIWEDPSDRDLMLSYLRRGGPIRNVVTRLRSKSGEIKCTAYSADWIQIDGRICIFAVSQDLLPYETTCNN